jgi:hypothetical protein
MNRIAILNTSLEVNGWEANAEQNGSTYDISIVHSDDPTKKYIYKQKLNGAEAAKVLEDLKTVLKDSKAMQFVKGLKFFKVNAKKVRLRSESLIKEVVASKSAGIGRKTIQGPKTVSNLIKYIEVKDSTNYVKLAEELKYLVDEGAYWEDALGAIEKLNPKSKSYLIQKAFEDKQSDSVDSYVVS